MVQALPLHGIRVVEVSSTVAGAYAGRLLEAMGAEVILIEPPTGSPLRTVPPIIGDSAVGALFASLSVGKRSVVLDLSDTQDQMDFDALVASASILIDDTPLDRRQQWELDQGSIAVRHPHLVHLSVLPFGAAGPKSGWKGEEVNLFHAGGEGYLMPNGLSTNMFPDRAPIKVHGYFAERQGGVAGALAALSALWSGQGQFVDVAVQDANIAVGAFAIQRYGDGSLEHRSTRSFRYGGVIECADGYVELLTLEERQWEGLVELMGRPEWALNPTLSDSVARSVHGPEINGHIRQWAKEQFVEELVAQAQRLGVPMARYNTPAQVVSGKHEQARGIFAGLNVGRLKDLPLQTAPFRFGKDPLPLSGVVPELGADQILAEPDQFSSDKRASPGRRASV
ncbi:MULTISPECIES: CoA transferase [Brucella]|uniref:CAIB/BAIF family protein n=1 Tax=Ochrobactrum soli TaxID=2448455 RepID=A0A2P9HBZ0_9HYPH|nr:MULTISPECIES: CoA transferase [Brucella]MDX4072802.1 CoA transferase [Brucella sp. NBRC 113783]SPL61616.1 CAIB/BAIF family protein [[Ochrobactrum] soli]